MTGAADRIINEYLLEVRYSPNAKILDYRGTWAESVSKFMDLRQWEIVENRFDVFDKEQTRRFFVSYRNAGALIHNSSTRNYFPDQANKFLRFLFDQKAFGDSLLLERLGVRARFATSFDGSFEELLNRYSTRFLTINPKVHELMNATIIDIAGPIDFSTKNGKINTSSGPMPKEQVAQAFSHEKDLPDIALYFDFDYWIRPNTTFPGKEILDIIKSFSGEIWDFHESLISLILG
jgi:hypothetical protein